MAPRRFICLCQCFYMTLGDNRRMGNNRRTRRGFFRLVSPGLFSEKNHKFGEHTPPNPLFRGAVAARRSRLRLRVPRASALGRRRQAVRAFSASMAGRNIDGRGARPPAASLIAILPTM